LEKVMNHKSNMNVGGESHGRVVPAKCPNKDGKPSAEGAEGRRPTKENTEQTTASQMQSWGNALSGLGRVREAAGKDKRLRFTALLHHVTVPLLLDGFYALKREAAPGVDGMTWKEYETDLDKRLEDLHSRVHLGSYRAQPSKRAYIPKADGRQRPLGIAALEDKIVRAAKLVGVLAGENPPGNLPSCPVVIPGGGEGDQSVESPGVKVPVGWVKTWSAPTGGRANRQVVARANRS
jgi:RNA-directed DNA polymerase